MRTITPHLWFDTQAKEAATFYTEIFPDSRITHSTTLNDTPSGNADIVSFELAGHPFMAISAGPYFQHSPAISFMVNFDPSQDEKARQHLEELWARLSAGGKELMPLQEYPFSKLYGWIQDKFGVTWQLILTDPQGEPRPFIMPALLFTQAAYGKAAQAVRYYTSVFEPAKIGTLSLYPSGMEPNKEGTVMFSDFQLGDQWFVAMDGGGQHDFTFSEALSFVVNCDSQSEIDTYWAKLSAVPEAEQCGWLKDQFGVSWQIVPTRMQEMMSDGKPEQIERVTKAFLKMKKFNLEELEKAYATA